MLQALSGFLMMMTQNGKLLYISDNAAEYLGHSMVSVLKVSELFELLGLRVSLESFCRISVAMTPRFQRKELFN